MFRIAAILVFAACLGGCDFVSTMKDAKAVESDLELSTGVTPQVGFNSHNGSLVSVTVIFPRLYETRPLRELAEKVRGAVGKNFKQTPGTIVLGFSLAK